MKSSFVSLLVLAFGLCVAAARLVAADAIVLKLSGSVKATLPGQTQSIDIRVGDKLPQGATITTGAGSEVFIEPYAGTVATIKPNSTVVIETLTVVPAKRTALLDLKSGSITSTIDPVNRTVTDYGVRTPKGVAAARGTVFSVSVLLNNIFIAALADTVEFTTASGTKYTVNAGMVSVTPAGGETQAPVPISQAGTIYPDLKAAVESAFESVLAVVQGQLGGIEPASAQTLLKMVTEIAVAVSPENAATIQAQADTAIAPSTDGDSGPQGPGAEPVFPRTSVDPSIVSPSS